MDFPQHTSSNKASFGEVKKSTFSMWTHLREFWKRPYVRQAKLEGFVLLTGLLLGTLLVLGSVRQRTARSEIKFLVQATYYLSGHALSYVLGAISNDSPVDNALIVVWAVILLVLYGSSDNVGSESLGDNESRRKRFLWDYMVPTVWFLALLLFKVPPQKFWIPLLLLMLLFLLKLRERKLALVCACRSRVGLDRITRVVADYMMEEHKLSEAYDPATMGGYKYLVGMKEAVEEVVSRNPLDRADPLNVQQIITLEKIWQSDQWLLNSGDNLGGNLKDTCLSFSLFWLLLRRFADYDLDELSTKAPHSKTRRFVLEGLIRESDNKSCERAFRVIEVELDFVYDYFYNNYYAVYSRGGTRYLLVRLGVVGLYFVVSFVTLHQFKTKVVKPMPWYDANHVQILVTKIVIYALIAIELAQIAIILTSKWVKVKWVCNYVANRRWWEKKIGKCAEWLLHMLNYAPCIKAWFNPWQRKLQQYSLLDSYGHTPKVSWFKCLLEGYIDFPTNGQKESKPIKLSTEVMKAVIRSIRTINGALSNGAASLERNRANGQTSSDATSSRGNPAKGQTSVDGEASLERNRTRGQTSSNGAASLEINSANGQTSLDGAARNRENLSWACETNGTECPVILIWHIATSICEMSPPNSPEVAENFQVATSLSKYCAYLIALAPKLLPDHVYITQCLFDKVVFEARETLKDCSSKESVRDKLQGVTTEVAEEGPSSVLKKGALLGSQLMNIQDVSRRWKVLADFWAEMIVYLAPSKDASVHAEYLVSGGEFITHLWALLTHAGIVDRENVMMRQGAPDVQSA